MYDIPLLLGSKQYFFISHMISPTDLFHPSPAPHFETFQVFLIYCPKAGELPRRKHTPFRTGRKFETLKCVALDSGTETINCFFSLSPHFTTRGVTTYMSVRLHVNSSLSNFKQNQNALTSFSNDPKVEGSRNSLPYADGRTLTSILLMWRIGRAPNSIPIYSYVQQDATSHNLYISGNCSTCFGWNFHPSSGAHTTVSTASGICHAVTAI
jgi:hypothetical protein